MKRVTIQDIADELGISRNTVSKAINNASGLADATRKRILQKAVEMGYKQFSYVNAHSSAVLGRVAQNRGVIALLFGGVIAPAHFATLMLDKLKSLLPQWGYTLVAHRVDPENILRGTLPLTFDPGKASAIVCVEMFDRTYDEMICTLGLPVLFVDGPNKRDGIDLPADQLYMDNTTAITRFVNDMLVRGRQRIGFIGDYEHCQSFFERYTAFRYSMLMAQVPVDERFCIKTSDPDRLEDALAALTFLFGEELADKAAEETKDMAAIMQKVFPRLRCYDCGNCPLAGAPKPDWAGCPPDGNCPLGCGPLCGNCPPGCGGCGGYVKGLPFPL